MTDKMREELETSPNFRGMGGAVKADNKALYNAEKVEFFGARMVRAAKRSEG